MGQGFFSTLRVSKGHVRELSLHEPKTALTLDHPAVLPPALSSTRAAAAVLVVAVAAVLPLRVPASCFDLVQRSQFGNGFALQQLAVREWQMSFPSDTKINLFVSN